MKKLFPEIPVLNNGQIELRALTQADAEALEEMVNSRRVYRYLPTFLFEKKYPDVREVIRRLYTECLEESLILGVFSGDGSSFDTFCGLAEMYGYKEKIHKISLGCRLAEHALGKGIGTQVFGMMADLLLREKGIGIITASSMIENRASARALEKTVLFWWSTRRKKTGDLIRRLWQTSGSCSAGPGTKTERIDKYDHELFRRHFADEIY